MKPIESRKNCSPVNYDVMAKWLCVCVCAVRRIANNRNKPSNNNAFYNLSDYYFALLCSATGIIYLANTVVYGHGNKNSSARVLPRRSFVRLACETV